MVEEGRKDERKSGKEGYKERKKDGRKEGEMGKLINEGKKRG